jgi:hypothetical protein
MPTVEALRALCRKAGIRPSPVLLEVLGKLDGDDARRRLLRALIIAINERSDVGEFAATMIERLEAGGLAEGRKLAARLWQ